MRAINFFFLLLIIICFTKTSAQNIWTQKTDFGGSARIGAVGFSIGDKGYLGTGENSTGDFWQYDPATDTWTQKADVPGSTRANSVGFSIGSKGYVGLGLGSDTDNGYANKEFWEYDPVVNTWTQKANFPAHIRSHSVGFGIGEKGYVGLGYYSPSFSYYKDLWEYDPATDSWMKKANFVNSRIAAVAFTIGNKGYVGTGFTINVGLSKDLWQYDPATDVWTQKSDLPAASRESAIAFSIGGKGYVGAGLTLDSSYSYQLLNDFWVYDATTNAWAQQSDFEGGVRYLAVGFSIGNKGYVGTGSDNVYPLNFKKDFWEFSPDCDSLTIYADADADGYGDVLSSTIVCDSILPTGYVYDNTDCNDTNGSINPGATEVCSNGIDDNCNGVIDENCCSIPTGLATTNITATSAQLNWNTVASATKYKLQYKRDTTGAPWITVTITAPNTSTVVTNLVAGKKYKWKVRSVCGSEKSAFSPIVKFTTLLRLGSETAQSTSVEIYPNPFSSTSTISFLVNENSLAVIELFDLKGTKIKTLLNDFVEAGNHEISFNREQLNSGIYLLQMKLSEEIIVLKIIIE